MAKLWPLTDEFIRETLGALDTVRAQFELDREDYVTRVGELRKLYQKHGHAKRLFLAALGRGAPNVDGEAPHVALGWFRSVERDTPLQTAVRHGGRVHNQG